MKKSLFKTPFVLTTCLILGLSIGLSACSNNAKKTPKAPKYKTLQTLNKEQKIETGTVLSVTTINIQSPTAKPYSNIGIAAGSGGFRGIYGSVDIGTLSRMFSNSKATQTAQEIIIKKSNGESVAITQVSEESFKQGDAVKVLLRNGSALVTH